MKFLKKIHTTTFIQYLLFISIPAVISALIMITNIIYFTHSYKQMLINNINSHLSSIYTNTENALLNIAYPVSNLSNDNNFINLITGKTSDTNSIKTAQNKLNEIEKNNTFIDSISVLIRSNEEFVITSNSIHDMATFFNQNYIYNDYSYTYWKEYRYPSIEKRYLAPTQVYKKNNDSSKYIIPLIFSKLSNVHMNNLIIVNIDLTKLLQQQRYTFPEAEHTGIVNKYTRFFYTINDTSVSPLDKNFFILSGNSKNASFDYTIKDNKYLTVTYSPRKSILGYTYATFISYDNINKLLQPIKLFSLILFIFTLLLLSAMTYFSTTKIYSPIKSLASIASINSKQDLIGQLHKIISELTNVTKTEQTNIIKLSHEQEHLLINLLNSAENSSIPSLNSCRASRDLDFKYDYFCSIIINLKLSSAFYSAYNAIDYNTILNDLYTIIQHNFSEKFDTYVIPCERNTLYILLNLTETDTKDDIIQIIRNITDILKYDSDYICLNFWFGGIYKDLVGLKKSHQTALHNVDLQNSHTQLNLYNISSKNDTFYIFSTFDEENLFNLLLTNKINQAADTIDKLAELNIQNDIPDSSIMQMYSKIIALIFKVLKIKHIKYDHQNAGDYILITEATSFSLIHARNYIRNLLNSFSEQSINSNAKVDINAIINYIESNYQKELFLDNIAETFGTTPKYLSKIIKTHLGVTFLTYLSALRVSKAKELLKFENKNINDIYQEVGFSNRNAFTQSFKKIVGITPSEYKRLIHTKNIDTK